MKIDLSILFVDAVGNAHYKNVLCLYVFSFSLKQFVLSFYCRKNIVYA